MAEESPSNETATAASTGGGLMSLSFQGLLFTQMLTAVNDNIFRWLVIGIGKQYVEPSQIGNVLMAGTACFVLPYILLAAPAGYVADRFSKRSVIVVCKFAEIVIMIMGVAAIMIGNLWILFAAVALMGAQSALFSPAKMGSIPEMLKPQHISAANGLFGLTTVSATVVGMGLGSWLSDATGDKGQEKWWLSAVMLIGVAAIGTLFSLLIRHLPAANPRRTFPWNAVTQTVRDVRTLASNGPMLRVALGIVFFWSLAALAQLNIDQFAAEGGAVNETAKIPLLMSLVCGVGVGSILAGIWSGGRVELGILPLGAIGVALSSMLLFAVQGTIIEPSNVLTAGFIVACVLLFALGNSAGLFSVPLDAYMQHRSPTESRGSILAASNFMTFTGVLLSAFLYSGLRMPMYAGSLDNIDANIRGLPLTEESQQHVNSLAAEFRKAAESDPKVSLDTYLTQAAPDERTAALTELLWIELKTRSARNEYITKFDYLKRFNDHPQLVKGVFEQAGNLPLLTSQQIFLICGLCTIPVLIYVLARIPQASIRFIVWLASHSVYRIRVYGRHNIPEQGGALLACNHVTWLDAVFLVMMSSRPVRLVGWVGNFERGFFHWMSRLWGVIPISSRPKQMLAAFETAREALKNGELVVVFPEGGITRTGQLQGFRPGLMRMLEGTNAPVIPVYLDELWGSIFSFDRGKFFWKMPRRWPYPISIHFGKPVEHPQDIYEVRQAVQELGAMAVQQRNDKAAMLPGAFLRTCKKRKRRAKVTDSMGGSVTGGMLLLRSLVLRRLLRRHVLKSDEQYVGLLLPPSTGGIIANAALMLDRRIAVNLNYTVSSQVMNECIAQAGIKHVLTSRKFMENFKFELNAELIYLDDFKDKVTTTDKIVAGTQAFAVPAWLLERLLGLKKIKADDVMTIIFTSGSTGTPKGVMLTYGNVGHNVDCIEQVIHLKPTDTLIGIVPLFHSFGYTIAMWGVLGIDIMGVYHFSPLDAKRIGKLCREHAATVLLATPTFLRLYLLRCQKEDFASLNVVVAGAERLPSSLCDAFEEKFGVRPVEGYGATELSPLVSVNIPPSRSIDNFQADCKEGTVGRPVPGVSAKVTHLDTGEVLGVDQPGMLWIKGPNVMKGYLGRPDLTGEAIKDGWYLTGDVAVIDEDGFIRITGRESRFSKIGGEMVPHLKIEEALHTAIGATEEDGQKFVVTAVPDPKKGERLIVIHTAIDRTPDELCKALAAAGLPNIFIPGTDSFHQVEELPMLGSGKLDLKAIKQLALEKFGKAV
jgi:acyl-[acyl-carrier-protein]-phospholipid O-acyltransferase/long-chain-fatty-acid--[acyl-carrier-protein] ligase